MDPVKVRQVYYQLSALLEGIPVDEESRAPIETYIKELEDEMEAKISTLTEEGSQLYQANEYQKAHEKFIEAYQYVLKEELISSIEEKQNLAYNSFKARELNKKAVELCMTDDFGAAFDKFEEALNFVNNDFLFDLVEKNIDAVSGLMFKKYLKEGEGGMSRIEQATMMITKLMQDVASFKVQFN